jgi:hypothetical protein
MARWHSCNIFQPGQDFRSLWQFSVGAKFALQNEQKKLPSEKLTEKFISKDWQSLFQPRLNVAWLPPEKVFLRVIQLPKADYAETRNMVELQLEKLSPLPVAQIAWGFQLLSSAWPDMQTAIVIVVARAYVEEFLTLLEGQGFMADRLELPFLDQLRATSFNEDGAWIFTGGAGAGKLSCLVAWWYNGTLQNLALILLPPDGHHGQLLQSQLAQMTWAGEFEGWLVTTPKYHIVAPNDLAEVWKTYFAPDQNVQVIPALPPAELAQMTAKRVVSENLNTNLLPPDYTTRYKQRFVDRLWMRGIGVVLLVYIVIAAAYLGWVQYAEWSYTRVEERIASLGGSYTNALQLKDKVQVMRDQKDLQFMALDCWKSVSDSLPAELTLKILSFDRGKKLSMTGTAGKEEIQKIYDFNDTMRKLMVRGQLLFSKVPPPQITPAPGGQSTSWSFVCDVKRTGVDE